MQNDVNKQEYLSALADGELEEQDFHAVLQLAATPDGQQTWQMYHLIGETLRSGAASSALQSVQALPMGVADGALLSRLREQMAQEPHTRPVLAAPEAVPVAVAVRAPAANDAVFRWKLLAGGASFAAVMAVTWALALAPGAAPGSAQMAAAPLGVLGQPVSVQTPDAPVAAAVASVDADAAGPVMLRDPRLDQLLDAQRQYGNSAALQMPASFLRNANFAAPRR